MKNKMIQTDDLFTKKKTAMSKTSKQLITTKDLPDILPFQKAGIEEESLSKTMIIANSKKESTEDEKEKS